MKTFHETWMEDDDHPGSTPLTFGADPGMLPSIFNMVRQTAFIVFVNFSGYNGRILMKNIMYLGSWYL